MINDIHQNKPKTKDGSGGWLWQKRNGGLISTSYNGCRLTLDWKWGLYMYHQPWCFPCYWIIPVSSSRSGIKMISKSKVFLLFWQHLWLSTADIWCEWDLANEQLGVSKQVPDEQIKLLETNCYFSWYSWGTESDGLSDCKTRASFLNGEGIFQL